MKALAKVLLVVTALIMSHRAVGTNEWNLMEDFRHLSPYENCGGEADRRLTEGFNHSPWPGCYKPYAPSDTSAANTPTPVHANLEEPHPKPSDWEAVDPVHLDLEVPDPDHFSWEDHIDFGDLRWHHFLMEDHFMSPPTIASHVGASPPGASGADSATPNTPFHSFEPAPANLATETLGSSLDELCVNSVAASKKSKIRTESTGQVKPRKKSKIRPESMRQVKLRKKEESELVQQTLPLLDCIRMNEKEVSFHELVFDEKVFQWPLCDARNFVARRKSIDKILKNRAAESPSTLPLLVIDSQDVKEIEKAFNSRPRVSYVVNAPAPSYLATDRISDLLEHSEVWKKVYEKRLGIDFETSLKWITQTANASPVPVTSYTAHNLNKLFVAYIFFVDMIITIRPQPGEVRVDRMKAFRTAVTSFESVTPDV
ncbi:hypothetical protein PCANC_09275 [Puccinia coronata f. sp. avenae]|uniref:Uncharacterized protein n=1 Tax=Puccinia coronata f. sp. avenae TaxID=200324 RepID=A0A2N5T309_9BASI|nr:hypothetical protein PCANC_09275 [Puccinia coronata f. sp. avenae]